MVERGVFIDSSEAVHEYMNQVCEMDKHDDIKLSILRTRLEAAEDEIGQGITVTEESMEDLLNEMKSTRTEPIVWRNICNKHSNSE